MAITVRMVNLLELAKFATKEDFEAAGEYALKLQRERIARGEGQTGKPMRKYDPDYAKERAEAGLPNDKRTLSRTGSMLASRAVVAADEKSAKVGFKSAPKHAYVHQKKTPFVKATKRERFMLTNFLRLRIEKRLKEQQMKARGRKV